MSRLLPSLGAPKQIVPPMSNQRSRLGIDPQPSPSMSAPGSARRKPAVAGVPRWVDEQAAQRDSVGLDAQQRIGRSREQTDSNGLPGLPGVQPRNLQDGVGRLKGRTRTGADQNTPPLPPGLR